MQSQKIQELGRVAFGSKIRPVKRETIRHTAVVGFDTEYTSKTGELLSFQLHTGERGVFCVVTKSNPMTLQRIYAECCKLLMDNPREIVLVTYFSPAELQFLPVKEALSLREYSKKSTDCTFRVNEHGYFLHVYDVFRWFDGQPLSKAAASLGLGKLEQDTSNMTRRKNETKKGRQYAINDAFLCVEILRQLRETFISNAGADPLVCKTPASASAFAFRRNHVTEEMYCDNNAARVCAMRGTWGGRAEVFRRGKLKGKFTEWDFTSAYPAAVLKLREMPIQKSWKEFSRMSQTKKFIGGFAHVRFRFPGNCVYPCLPVTVKSSTVYPLQGESHCTLQEIRHALYGGCDIRILDGWGYAQGSTALRDYIQWTLEQRKSASGAAKIMYKLLGNSIIGKLAQRIYDVPLDEYFKVAEEIGCDIDDVLELNVDELHSLGVTKKASVGPIFMPEWNGLITGYTRAALAQMIESGDAVYCHTDSVWTRRKPKCELLPFEKKGTGEVVIIRARLAAIGKLSKRGVFKTKTTHMPQHSIWCRETARKVLRDFDGSTIRKKYDKRRPQSFLESIAAGVDPYTWHTQERTASTFWDEKRELLPDGNTRPWKNPQAYLDASERLRKALRAMKKAEMA